MTGKNATIWDLTVSEIAELDLKTTVKYSKIMLILPSWIFLSVKLSDKAF